MKSKKLILIIPMLASFLFIGFKGVSFADDLDDDISQYTDESIAGESEMGKADTNTSFIIQDALAKAKMAQKKKEKDKEGGKSSKSKTVTNDKNEDSIVLEAGTSCNGCIIVNAPGSSKKK